MPSVKTDDALTFRHPSIADGAAIWQLVINAGTLDQNSSYLYLLLCRDFADCCAVAERDGQLQGFVTGFRSFKRPDVWFVWQVGVAPSARGQGLAKRLTHFVLRAQASQGVCYLETTVTASNSASRALFSGIAKRLGAELLESELFNAELFPESGHESEPLLRIGPFEAETVKQSLLIE
ncbi:diaminobutyrate acetyltransferase [Methylomarinum sp. Ch1-1]|uniref:L-2,4-diaminobutyric acid acetyltransferase n=1 Tax=Methylomarinum roseum TaxID=3067653 RepID=A0AAU7NX14_9GAMM|nr:diaminobutyrate acetyltransferase [Methylomarinum sp. Ch1-1]MDP4522324.1 diaminobutyrate acetyltransferase [Methylomarinum sp. Ch1-1]